MGTTNIVVDTDIIIDFLKKRQPGAELLKKAYLKHRIHITSITVYELLYAASREVTSAQKGSSLSEIVDIAKDCSDTDLSIHHDKYLYGEVMD